MGGGADTADEVEGLIYVEDFISVAEEEGLLDFLAGFDFRPVVMRGQAAKRTVRHSTPAGRSGRSKYRILPLVRRSPR